MKDSNSFYVLLGLLQQGPMSGYDIKKTVEGEIGYYYKISNGQIYPTLKQLLQIGYATLTVEKHDGKPDRKVYMITGRGTEAFLEWLNKPVDYGNPSGNELLLKLYFGEHATAEQNIRLITAYMEMKAAMLREYEEIAKLYDPFPFSGKREHYSYLTLRYGQILVEAGMQWGREAIESIRRREG